MINWSFRKLSLVAETLSLQNSSGIVRVYKTLLLFGLILSVSLTIFVICVSSPIIIILFLPFCLINNSLKLLSRLFTREKMTVNKDYSIKLLKLGDTEALKACQELLEICQVDGQLKLGLFKDSPCHYKILYLQGNNGDLIGFVEFFSRVGEEEYFIFSDNIRHICIEKLIMNSEYEGFGFTKVLVESLQELTFVSSIEVWSLWRSESFYKKLGFVDVVALQQEYTRKGGKRGSFIQDLQDSKNLKRVVGDFGPLLIWNR